jgi:hypothetical protein
MARNSYSALPLGLAAATLTLALAGGTALAQTSTAAPPADAPQAAQAPAQPPAAGNQLQPPPYYQPGQPSAGAPAYPQQTYPQQPYPQQPYPPQPYSQYPQQPYPQYPAQPYYGQPYQQPVYVPPPYSGTVVRRYTGYTDRFRPQFGIGVRFSGLYAGSDLTGYGAGGIGFDMLLRVHPRWTLEASLQYQHVTSYDAASVATYYDRYDIPILGGARLHLGNPFWNFSPYLVGAVGATYTQIVFDPSVAPEGHWFFEGQGGIGFELRLGRHFLLNIDMRGFGRVRPSSSSDGMVTVTNGYSNYNVTAVGNSGGVLFNFGFAGLF